MLVGLACGVKIYAVLLGLGLAWPLLRRREWLRTGRIAAVAIGTLALQYSFYGVGALKPVFGGLKLVTLPSPWRVFELSGQAVGINQSTMETIISCLWPIALFVVAALIFRRISSDQPSEIVAPFALTFAWILVAPWVFAWVHRRRLGRPDPGSAQPDDPVADDRHGSARALPVQRRPGRPRTMISQATQAPDGQAASWRAATAASPASLRRHWLAVLLLTAGLALRVLAQLGYRPALFYIDTVRYLYNADGMDPVGYKGLLWPVLAVANLDAVAAVQHLLGLGMAAGIYVLLLRRGASRWLAALAIAPVLLDAYQLQDEQAIMPGTLFETLIAAWPWPSCSGGRASAGGVRWRPGWCSAPRPQSPRSVRR